MIDHARLIISHVWPSKREESESLKRKSHREIRIERELAASLFLLVEL